jgi:hypothetical protein
LSFLCWQLHHSNNWPSSPYETPHHLQSVAICAYIQISPLNNASSHIVSGPYFNSLACVLLQKSYFQINSHSEVLGIITSMYLFL